MSIVRIVLWLVTLLSGGSFVYMLQDNTLVLGNVAMCMGSGLLAIVFGCLLWATKDF